jgi:hypothetical protein
VYFRSWLWVAAQSDDRSLCEAIQDQASLDVIIGTAIAYIVIRTGIVGRKWLNYLATAALAVPGVVLGWESATSGPSMAQMCRSRLFRLGIA